MSTTSSASNSKSDPAADRENVLSTLDQWVEQSKKRLTLPSAPPPSKGWPTPWITKEVAEEYFEPLASRGWGIEFTGGSKRSAQLKRTIRFKNYDLAIAFMSDIGRVSKAENHHASIVSITPAGSKAHISLSVQTHSAQPPDWVPSPDSNTNTAETNKKGKRTWAGITPRDIRFAVLLEQVLDQNLNVDHAVVGSERAGKLDWDAFVKECKASFG